MLVLAGLQGRALSQLAGLFRELPAVMRAAAKGLPASTRVLRAARPLVDVLYPAGRNLEPFFRLGNAFGPV